MSQSGFLVQREENILEKQSLELAAGSPIDSTTLSQFSRTLQSSFQSRSAVTDYDLLVNGQFELSEAGQSTQFDFEVPGWHAYADAQGDSVLDIVDRGKEGNALKLDTSSDRFDRIYQDVSLVAGQDYLLTFELKAGCSLVRAQVWW